MASVSSFPGDLCKIWFIGSITIVYALWTSPVGMVICSLVFGFFGTSYGSLAVECAYLLTGPKQFNFAHGYMLVVMGTGWILGAPAAGKFL